MFASCSTTTKTATSLDVPNSIHSSNTTDLIISPTKVSLNNWEPTKKIKNGGKENVKKAAIAELLQQNGNADVLVAPQFEYTSKRGSIKRISVSGYPARYTNFQVK